MMPTQSFSIPIELMEILTKINDNISETKQSISGVKERMARLEAQEHSDAIREVRNEIDKERDSRVLLQIELASIKTRLAPIIVGISMAGATLIEVFFTHFIR